MSFCLALEIASPVAYGTVFTARLCPRRMVPYTLPGSTLAGNLPISEVRTLRVACTNIGCKNSNMFQTRKRKFIWHAFLYVAGAMRSQRRRSCPIWAVPTSSFLANVMICCWRSNACSCPPPNHPQLQPRSSSPT